MKITQEKVAFRPVIITLETLEEAKTLLSDLAGMVGAPGRQVVLIRTKLREFINEQA